MRPGERREGPLVVEMPAPTASPMVAALGVTLLLAGLVTNVVVSVAGVVLLLVGVVGWFREVLPVEHREVVTVPRVGVTTRPRPTVPPPAVGEGQHRARLPVEIYPVSAGLRGGIAGGIAMAGLALLYGLIGHRSIWYPINLLAASVSADLADADTTTLYAFSMRGLVLGTVIHGVTSVLVGLLYGVLLPMIPRRPLLLGGIVAPLAWTGLLYATLGIINPTLNERIDWPWFVASQLGFGLVAGLVVARSERVRTLQHLPFAVRAGFEMPDGPESPR